MSTEAHRRAHRATTLAALGLLSVGGACDCRGRAATAVTAPDAGATGPGAQRVVAAPVAPVAAPGSGARVVVDVSQSIAGFTRTGRRVLSVLHVEVIEHALSELHANAPFQRCALDEALRCDGAALAGDQLDRADTYHGHNAALDLALRRPAATADPLQRIADPLDPFELSVIVTDGFQSAHSQGGAAGASAAACAAGADPACIGELLAERVREGYGVWIGRVFLPFRGAYYPERQLDDAMWARVEAHLAELAAPNSGWDNVHFGARRGGRHGASGAFQWEGARPMLVIILSRAHARGRALVEKIREGLRHEPTLFPRSAEADVSFAELAPFEGITGQVAADGVARVGSGPGIDAVVVDGTTRLRGVALTNARCSIEGAADLSTAGAVTFGAVPPPPFVQVTASWRLSGAAAEGATLVSPRDPVRVWPPPSGAAPRSPFPATWRVDCRQLAPGMHEHRFGVHVAWQLDERALAAEWYMRESADTAYEAPEKVFRLRQMVQPSITAATNRRGWLDQWVLRLTRR